MSICVNECVCLHEKKKGICAIHEIPCMFSMCLGVVNAVYAIKKGERCHKRVCGVMYGDVCMSATFCVSLL